VFLIIKEIVVVTVAVISAIFTGFSFSPEAVFAPDLPPPARISIDAFSPPLAIPITSDDVVQETESEVEMAETGIVAEEESSEPTYDPRDTLADVIAEITTPSPAEPENPGSPLTPQAVNELVRSAIVNIVCITERAGPVNPISGSGVVIDSGGTILTNAHVAQYLLLKDYPSPNFVECIVRTGSPARATYTAELLFLPPSWIADNAHKIDDENPVGNGEHDWALIRISGIIQGSGAPRTLPSLPLATTVPTIGDPIIAAGYPAGFLGGITIARELHAASAASTIQNVYTFGDQTIDVFSVGGTIVAQQGSSGGAIVNMDGVLTGVIVTTTNASVTALRDLRAISTEYIMRDFISEVGVDIETFFSSNLDEEGRLFRERIAPRLTQALVSVLEN
jgi:hypothetical protein